MAKTANTDKTHAEMNPESTPHANAGHDGGAPEQTPAQAGDADANKNASFDGGADGWADDAAGETAAQPADVEALASLSPKELLERLTQAVAKNAQMKDGLLRARAEVENIRRRAHNEIVAARKFAIEGFARELLGAKDSLEQASGVELGEGAGETVRQMKEGIELTLKQLDGAMTGFSVVEVEAAPGIRFDPERHQAISMTPSEDIEAGHIVHVLQKGFLLKERLLRPAMVVVAAKCEPAESKIDAGRNRQP